MNADKAQAQAAKLMLKGALSDMPEDQQDKWRGTYARMRAILDEDTLIGASVVVMLGVEIAAGDIKP